MAQGTNKKGIAAAGLAAAAGIAAGYYFYASKDAGKNRKVAAKWAGELKDDVVERAKKLKNIDRKTIAGVIDSATKAYAGARALDRKELAQAASELKTHWEKIVKEVGAGEKKAVRTVKAKAKSVKKRVAKTVAEKK